NNEKPSFKLEEINKENSLVTSGRAHEAMTDVEATFNLAKRLASKREIYDYSIDFFNKRKDELRIEKFKDSFKIGGHSFKLGIMVSHQLGYDCKYMAPVINIGKSIKYSNQNLWIRLDKENIMDFISSPEESMALVIRKRYGDIPIILPAIDRFYEKLLEENINQAENNLKTIANNSSDFFKIINFHREYQYPYIPDLDPDATLYQAGFFNKHEHRDMIDFHGADVKGKIKIANQMKSERIKILAQRIIQRNYPSDLAKNLNSEACEFDGVMDKIKLSGSEGVVKGFKNDTKLNCQDALRELEGIQRALLNKEQKDILSWLQEYIMKM
ncbi:MAG: exodeoxyribonuclease I, partial [Desulfobacteraceae bacterium]|nr:exodeoxyribonuclease I [Desulfobacteraceae bacterium]